MSLLDESGAPVSMAGALIPQGYELDKTISGRRWICPVRSCRIACKARKSLGYHFMVSLHGQNAEFLSKLKTPKHITRPFTSPTN